MVMRPSVRHRGRMAAKFEGVPRFAGPWTTWCSTRGGGRGSSQEGLARTLQAAPVFDEVLQEPQAGTLLAHLASSVYFAEVAERYLPEVRRGAGGRGEERRRLTKVRNGSLNTRLTSFRARSSSDLDRGAYYAYLCVQERNARGEVSEGEGGGTRRTQASEGKNARCDINNSGSGFWGHGVAPGSQGCPSRLQRRPTS